MTHKPIATKMLDKTDITGLLGVIATFTLDGVIHTIAGVLTAAFYAYKIWSLYRKNNRKE